MRRIILISLLLILLELSVQCLSSTVRRTLNGPVEGTEQISSLGQKYYSFKGIPFAEPPITGTDPYTGEKVDRRFKPTVYLKRKWTDTLKVHNFSKFCMQSVTDVKYKPNLSEDCLFLNVYVPKNGAKKKTVLVWIHGGGFGIGDGTDTLHGPDFLLSQDNVIVTIQYRVGIFGFLNLGMDEYSGNMGLKDQQLALKWVHKNIENFSGNKNEILLFGESAGGASVHFHMINEESRLYYNRALSISGTASNYFALKRITHLERVQKCFQTYDMGHLIEYLKVADRNIIMNCYPFIIPDDLYPVWVPTIENLNASDAFLTKTPYEIYNSDKAPMMDAIFGFTSQEIITFLPKLVRSMEPVIKEDWRETNIVLPFEGFTKAAYPKQYKKAVEILRKAYFSNTTNTDAIRRQNIALMSDLFFTDGILRTIVHQANANNRSFNSTGRTWNTYFFRFAANTDLNLFKYPPQIEYSGAAHGDDMCYTFHCHDLDQYKVYDKHLEQKDIYYDMIMRMAKMITNFARTGNPSVEGDTPFKPCKSEETFCQEISNNPKSSVAIDIKQRLHYDTWRKVEEIYKRLKIVPHEK